LTTRACLVVHATARLDLLDARDRVGAGRRDRCELTRRVHARIRCRDLVERDALLAAPHAATYGLPDLELDPLVEHAALI